MELYLVPPMGVGPTMGSFFFFFLNRFGGISKLQQWLVVHIPVLLL